MARRRVNIKFVIGLASVLAILAVVVILLIVVPYIRDGNPDRLVIKAQDALKSGDVENATRYYARAANTSLRKRLPQANDILMTLADVYYDNIDKDRKYLGQALGCWKQILIQDPNFLPAEKRYCDELYNINKLIGADNRSWEVLEQELTKLLTLEPKNAEAYKRRGESILVRISIDELSADRQKQAAENLQKALDLNPDSVEACDMLVRLWMAQSRFMDSRQKNNDAKKLRAKALDTIELFVQKHPQNSDAQVALGRAQLEAGRPEEAAKAFAKAIKLGLNNIDSASTVAAFYAVREPATAEKIFQRITEIDPNDMFSYYILGNFYQQSQRFNDAIEVLKLGLNKKGSAKGVRYERNIRTEARMLTTLAQVHLFAATADPAAAAGKEHLEQAASYIEQIRGAQPNHPLLPMLEGYSLMLRGKLPEAITQLKKSDDTLASVRELRGEWLNSKRWLALAYERSNDTGLAIKCLNDILQESPNNVVVLLSRAGLEGRLSQFDQMLDTANQILRIDPKNESALRLKANALARLGKVQESQKILTAIGGTDSSVNIAEIQLSAGETRQAAELLEQILSQQPDNQRALMLMINTQMALRAETQDKNVAEEHRKLAMTYLDRAIEKNSSNIQLKRLRSVLANENLNVQEFLQKSAEDMTDPFSKELMWANYYQSQRDNAKQLEHLQKAETLNPDSNEIIERIFTLALTTKNWELAEMYAQKAQRKNMDGANGKFYDGRIDLERGKYDDAITTLKAAVAVRPDYSVGRTALGLAYVRGGQESAAIEEFQKAIEQRPDNVVALRALIELNLKRGDRTGVTQAQTYLAQALKYAPNDAQLVMFDEAIGDPRANIARREKVRAADASNEDNLIRLAALYRRAGEPRKAIDTLKDSWTKSTANVPLGDQLAGAYQQAGETNNALTVYQQLIANPDQKVRYQAYLQLAQMYASLGQINDATSTLEAAAKIAPSDDDTAQRNLAWLALQVDNAPKAETLLKALMTKTPKDVETRQRLADALMRQGKFAESDALLADLLKDSPKNVETMLLQGTSLTRQKKFDEAAKVYTAVLQNAPDNYRALFGRAVTALAIKGDLRSVSADLVAARNLTDARQPGPPTEIRQLLARVYAQGNQFFEAVREWDDLVNARPDYIPARIELARLLLGLSEQAQRFKSNSTDDLAMALRQIQPIERLRTMLADAVRRYPGQPIWIMMQAQLLTIQGQTAQALDRYRAAFEETNQSLMAANGYTQALIQNRDFDKTVEVATSVLATSPDAVDMYLRRAVALANLGKIPESTADFNKTLDLIKDPGGVQVVYQQLKAVLPADAAIAFARKRMEKDSQDRLARIGCASLYSLLNQYSDSLDTIKPLLEDTKSATRPIELRIASLAAYMAKNYPLSQQYYMDLLKLNPEDIESLNNLAFMLADDLKKPAEGLVYAKRARELIGTRSVLDASGANYANLYDTIGWVKYLAGDLQGAADDLNRSLKWEPLPDAYLHLSQVFKKQGNAKEAKRNAELGLKLAQDRKDDAKSAAAQELLNGL